MDLINGLEGVGLLSSTFLPCEDEAFLLCGTLPSIPLPHKYRVFLLSGGHSNKVPSWKQRAAVTRKLNLLAH